MQKIEIVRGYVRKDGTHVDAYQREHEYAPGIPDKQNTAPPPEVLLPETWQFGLQFHRADRAGPHFDLRLGDPATGVAYSWAIPKARMPQPGEKVLAVYQPRHTVSYMSFKGEIREGYGKGTVELKAHSKVEVLRASSERVRFNLYEGHDVFEYVLVRTLDKQWLLMNVTPQRDPSLPSAKPPYKEMPPESIDPENDKQILQEKIDGAHVLFQVQPGKQVRVLSYRPTERLSGVIDHTWRIPWMMGRYAPKDVKPSIVRGELYAVDKEGVAVPAHKLGGLLNANVWKSREMQQQNGWQLRLALFDPVMVDGRRVDALPYSKKLETLLAFTKQHPGVTIPDTAVDAAGKRRILAGIREGKNKTTTEGFVIWHKDSAAPTKAKIRPDFDVHVRKVFPAYSADGKELDRAGGFEYSWTPGGPIAGRVGTGFDHKALREMKEFPERFVGRVAKVRSQEILPSEKNALRAPSFYMWHLDKGNG